MGGGGLFTCPYALKVQACPPRDQRPATVSSVSGRLKVWAQWAFARGPNKHRGPTRIVNRCHKIPSALSCPGAHSATNTALRGGTLFEQGILYLHRGR